jgi:tripartite-type tricarboxylate transporter receptor subunit TctC
VPTIAEAGVPGYEVSPWFAVFAPADTPADVVAKLNKALIAAMRQPEILKRLESVGAEPIGSTPQALAEHLNKELVSWGALIKERDIRLD